MELTEQQKQELSRATLCVLAAGVTVCLFLPLYHLACLDFANLGEGPRSWLWVSLVGIVYFGWLCSRVGETANDPARLAREAGLSLVVIPLAIVGGRFIGSGLGFCFWDSGIGALVGFLAGLSAMKYVRPAAQPGKFDFRRGTNLLTLDEAKESIAAVPESQPHIRWAGLELPARVAEGHFAAIGAPGSGKTLMHRELMASVLPTISVNTDCRALVYDLKRDLVSQLKALGLQCPIDILNPFDARALAWDIAKDLTNPHTAADYAASFIPERQGEVHPFFTAAAQTMLAGVLGALMAKAPGRWTLRDLIHLTGTPERLRLVLESTPQTAPLIQRYFEPRDTFQNILSTLANAMVRLAPVAAVWERVPAARHISLERWAKAKDSGSVLVMGAAFEHQETLTAINRVMFLFLSNALLSVDEVPGHNRAWFFIDELKEARRLQGLSALLTNGRSKGVRCVLGFQDLEGLQAIYGENEANEIAGMCANTSILRLASSHTADWGSKRIGDVEQFEYMHGSSTAEDRTRRPETTPTGEHLASRPAAYPSELMNLPPVKVRNVMGVSTAAVEGYHIIPELGAVFRGAQSHGLHRHDSAEDFRPRATLSEETLTPWTEADEARLGLTRQVEAKAKDAARAEPRKVTQAVKKPQPSRLSAIDWSGL